MAQIIKQNLDGTIKIEYAVYTQISIPHPMDTDGNLLYGDSLKAAINQFEIEQTDSDMLENQDLESAIELGVIFES